MAGLAEIVSITSGFVLMGYRGLPADLLATSIIVDLALAPVTALIAARRRRSLVLWSTLGLVFGMWALAAVLILPSPRQRKRLPAPGSPEGSRAA